MGKRRRSYVIAFTALAVVLLLVAVYFLYLVRPIQASPDKLALTQDDLPSDWTIVSSKIILANNTEGIGWNEGWSWDVVMNLHWEEGNYSVFLVIGSFNNTAKAHLAYKPVTESYRGTGWTFGELKLGDEGVHITYQDGYLEHYYFRDGNIVVTMEVSSGDSIIVHEQWMDDLVNIVADKINQYDIPIHV